MNPNFPKQQDTLNDGDDRLMDAMLHEHARAGAAPDEPFLTELAAVLDAEPAQASAARATGRRLVPLAWALGLAACLAMAANVLWHRAPSGDAPTAGARRHADGDATLLATVLPPELIEGTPKAINVPNLEPVPTRVPEFYVPAGTVLLSRGKKVTSSDANPIIGALDLVTDGDKDAGEGYYVELQEGLQWIQIDLGKSAPLYAIWLWHYHSQRRAYNAVIAQISDDPEFKTGVTTVFNNDYQGGANMGKATDRPYVETRFGKIIDAKGTKGRYVRLYSNGNSSNEMNHYIEVEVYGTAE